MARFLTKFKWGPINGLVLRNRNHSNSKVSRAQPEVPLVVRRSQLLTTPRRRALGQSTQPREPTPLLTQLQPTLRNRSIFSRQTALLDHSNSINPLTWVSPLPSRRKTPLSDKSSIWKHLAVVCQALVRQMSMSRPASNPLTWVKKCPLPDSISHSLANNFHPWEAFPQASKVTGFPAASSCIASSNRVRITY